MDSPFFRLVNALDAVPCIAGQSSRDLVIGQLRPAISGAIRYHAQRRLQVIEILRACLDHQGGVQELLTILAELEGDSLPLRRLVETFCEVLPRMGG
ncbi:MAG TPA: hypothetical protein VJT49_22110 [Amycolatopsis sp.]|uniref:effector-associated domain 2-containing protein n=1 Tax=Amycolatopsis sp. TaxID=37632 RepID=UPI002B498A4C|nr:hypothetical protein [Amycolatopsis sp.]HKS47755.1 hypothetical protein [Amycolatopsis sp.]